MSLPRKQLLLLIARVIIGVVFITAGWLKASDIATTIKFFHGFGLPAFLAYLVSYGEIVGGVALVLGLWLNLATLCLGIIMLGAIYFSFPGGFPMYSLPLTMFAALCLLRAAGPGQYLFRFKRNS